MVGCVNKVILIGNLGADPEIRYTQDGRPVANLRIATSESWKDKNTGERREKTEWHKIVIFNEGLCRIAEQYIKKGSTIYLEGQLQTRKWVDQQGQDRYTTEIILQGFNCNITMLGNRNDNQQEKEELKTPEQQQLNNPYNKPNEDNNNQNNTVDLDDDVPF